MNGRTVVDKSLYAKLKRRAPSAISNWIKRGKISNAALIGDGRSAKIWVEQADADLARSLDPSQQVSQLHSAVSPALLLPAMTSTANRNGATQAADGGREGDMARRAKADADRAEYEAEAARRKLAVDEGRWVDAQEAARAWGYELARLMTEVETFLFASLARELAEQHGLDWKALGADIRVRWRAFRTGRSADARARREALVDVGDNAPSEPAP
jgi:hypothetical protein